MSDPSRPQTPNGTLYARLGRYKELLETGSERDRSSARAELLHWVLLRYIPTVLRMKYPSLSLDADREGIIAEAQLLVWKRCEGVRTATGTPVHPSQLGGVMRDVAGEDDVRPRPSGLSAGAPTLQGIEWSRSTPEIVCFVKDTTRGALQEAMRGLDPYKRVARERSREFSLRKDEMIARRRRAGDPRECLTPFERRQLLAEVAPNATAAMLQRVEHGRVVGEDEALVASEPLGPEEIVTGMGDGHARRRLVEEIAALDPDAAAVITRAFAGEAIGIRDRWLIGRTEGVLARLHAYLETAVGASAQRGASEEDEERRALIQRVARVDFVAAMIVKRVAAGGVARPWERERVRSSASVVSILCDAPGPMAGLARVVGV